MFYLCKMQTKIICLHIIFAQHPGCACEPNHISQATSCIPLVTHLTASGKSPDSRWCDVWKTLGYGQGAAFDLPRFTDRDNHFYRYLHGIFNIPITIVEIVKNCYLPLTMEGTVFRKIICCRIEKETGKTIVLRWLAAKLKKTFQIFDLKEYSGILF